METAIKILKDSKKELNYRIKVLTAQKNTDGAKNVSRSVNCVKAQIFELEKFMENMGNPSSDTEVIRARRKAIKAYKHTDVPTIKLEVEKGRFGINNKAMELIGLIDNGAVMFALNKKKKCGYIYREDPEYDNYHVKYSDKKSYALFQSENLRSNIINVFRCDERKNVYFLLETEANEKGWYKFTLEN